MVKKDDIETQQHAPAVDDIVVRKETTSSSLVATTTRIKIKIIR